jgi:UDP-N-acetylglucosamine:LPS N-acetylglucosamine transferase
MSKTAVFVFPSAAGHINPALPLAKQLVSLGWKLEFLGDATFQEAIESTGATFHNRGTMLAEFGIGDMRAMVLKTLDDYDDPGSKMWALNFGSIATEKLLPGHISVFKKLAPSLIVYCPVLCQVAYFAALHLGIPAVSLLTAAGPGYWDAAFKNHGGSAAGLLATIKANEPNNKAIEGIRTLLNMPDLVLNTCGPLVHEYYAQVNLVTTVPSLADELNADDAKFYESVGKKFEFVGPLLGTTQATVAGALDQGQTEALFTMVDEAVALNRKVVYVSLGTVVTSSDPEHGWTGTSATVLTGKQVCQSVFRAVFEEFGSTADDAALVVVSCGPQSDALENVTVPDNAVCFKSIPQVQFFRRAKPSLFVTNGGQNSFIEALSVGCPLVVCPGFGDQQVNAAKAEAAGVGAKVDRPKKAVGDHPATVAAYQESVGKAVKQVFGNVEFLAKAKVLGGELERGGGVDRAVQLMLKEAGM